MKKLLLVLVSVLTIGTASLANTPKLTINGLTVEKVPVQLTFDGDNVMVHFADGVESYDMESVVITYETTALSDVQFSTLGATIGERLVVNGAINAQMVDVYDAAGRVVASSKVVDGSAVIDSSAWPKGTYILRNGKQCVKLQKR